MTVKTTLTIVVAAVLAVAGCSSATGDGTTPAEADSILAGHGLAGLAGPDIVEQLERTPVNERPVDLLASVRPGELVLSEPASDESATIDLPDDEFYLSVAPYVDQTHDCHFHSLTTCRGELAGAEVEVTITDRDTGEALVDQVIETFDNGFVGFWLPSGIDATVEITHDGYTGSEDISTGPDDPTCLTTLRLA